MRKLFCALVCMGLVCGVANAQPLIEFYFSDTNALDACPPVTNPNVELQCGESATYYIWAKVDVNMGQSWAGVDLGVTGMDFAGEVYNPDIDPNVAPPAYKYRWNGGYSYDTGDPMPEYPTFPVGDYYIPFEDGHANAVGVGEPLAKFVGLGDYADTWMYTDWTEYCYLYGEVTFTCPEECGGEMYEIFFYVGPGGIAPTGGGTGLCQFGAGDDPVDSGDFGAVSTVADLTITCVPEPASLLLLGLAGLALRRR